MELPKGLQCNLANVINMGHIQTYALVLSTEELTTHLKQDTYFSHLYQVIYSQTCLCMYILH